MAEAAPDPASAASPRPRVLVVDDDERNLLALSEVLRDIADIVCAESGTEALRHLLKEQFAVILLDVLMPGLDGYETAQLVRMREQSRDTPIIFLTAINKEDAHLLRGYDSGAVDVVFKPFDPSILRSKVGVFVSLYEKTREIERKAKREQLLLQESLRAQAEKLVADQALREAEERQALILRSLPLAVFLVDSWTGAPQFLAGDIRGITGLDNEAFAADPALWTSRIHPEDRATTGDPVVGGFDRTREYRWRHEDGRFRVFVEQRVPISGRPGMLAGTLRDVTEQRQLQDQLLQAQKLDAIGKLTGGIAHDFNNLLASVLSGVALLERRGEINDRGKEVLGMMRHAAQQGTHLVNRMLTFSRRQNLQPEIVHLAEIARTIDGMLAPVLGGLVRLSWDVENGLWPAYVDASQLELAIMNLVLNARDAMPAGGTVTIGVENRHVPEASHELQAGEYVVVSVTDTGTGIPPELLPKVLEPFFTTKEAGKGTGLGLSTVLGFAQQSGGTLKLQSEVGRGTVVEVWLPRARREVAPAGVPAAPGDTPIETDGRTTATVLLVDDSLGLRNLTEMHLLDAGYEVVCAGGGAEALALIEQEPSRFDVILTDYAMPLMSGLDVIRYARSLRARWPAVIITGYADGDAIAARPEDVALITKPFAQEALLAALRNAVAAGANRERP